MNCKNFGNGLLKNPNILSSYQLNAKSNILLKFNTFLIIIHDFFNLTYSTLSSRFKNFYFITVSNSLKYFVLVTLGQT